jgi:hypothetical protein
MNSVSVGEQVSLIHTSRLLYHSVSTHLTQRCRRFCTLPLSSTAFPFGSRLRLWLAGSSSGPAVSSLSSYGLIFHLLLLSTTHSCVAVAFGYRPESVFLERTCTSLTTRAFRRTSPALQCWEFVAIENEPVKRAAEGTRFSRPFHGLGFISHLIPPMNRWAIVNRPLRGLGRGQFPRQAPASRDTRRPSGPIRLRNRFAVW